MAIKYNTSLYVNGALKVNDEDVALQKDLTKVSEDVSTLSGTVEQNQKDIALKAAQSDLESLQSTVSSNSEAIALKASQSDLEAAQGDIESLQQTKADAQAVTELAGTIATKADSATVEALSEEVTTKADSSVVEALSATVETKADAQTVSELTATVETKADNTTVEALSQTVSTKADASALEVLATKQEVTEAIASVTQFKYEKVDELPESGVAGTIYLVLEDGQYSEYLWIGDAFERFGPAIDLSGYQTDKEAEAALLLKADKTTVDTLSQTVETKADAQAVTDLAGTVATKADSSVVEALSATVDTKADAQTVSELTETVGTKADNTTVEALSQTVSTKADNSAVEALSATVDTKADASTVETLSSTVDTKANADDVYTKTEVDTKVAHNHYEVTSLDSISGMKEGDTAIVKVAIKDGETEAQTIYSHTAYIYDEGAWKALDGNYNADNVYIDEDITFAGGWTSVGNVAIDSTIKTKGMSLSTLLTTIFTQELDGAAKTNPYYKVTLSGNTATVEAGATFNPKFTISEINTGAYTYGSNAPDGTSTGVTFTGFTGTASGGTSETVAASSDAVSGTVTFTSVTAEDGKTYTFKITATRNAAQYVAVTNLGSATKVGSDTTPGYSFAAASNVSPSASGSFTVTGDRYTWYGDVIASDAANWDPEALTATQVKTLANKQWTDVTGIKNKTFSTRVGMIKMFICAPAGKYSTISLTQKSPELTISLTKATNKVVVPGAGSDTGVEYDVFYYSGDAGYGATNTMTINAA